MKTALGIACLVMTTLPSHAQSYITLDYMRGHARPVLIFAPYATPQVIEQLHILAQGQHDMDERNVVPVPLCLKEDSTAVCRLKDVPLSPDEQAKARRRLHIHPNDFTVILLGKDGGEKLRSHHPISLETLRSTPSPLKPCAPRSTPCPCDRTRCVHNRPQKNEGSPLGAPFIPHIFHN